MKFVKETTSKGLQIPTAAMKLSGFESSGKVELHASEDTLVVLKQRMTAMELVRAARSLQKLATDLHVHLARVCGHCDGCDGECPLGAGTRWSCRTICGRKPASRKKPSCAPAWMRVNTR